MRSSLKKSIYLGLAALSFAGVAGATLNNATASAKTKKTHKKVTKKAHKKTAKKVYAKIAKTETIANQDSSTSALNLKSGELLSKPAGVKGSKQVASGLSASELYMPYQKVTLKDGSVFYKVVSFSDHSHRGFVNANDVTTAQTYTVANVTSNTQVYLANPGNQAIYLNPQGSTFKDHKAVEPSFTSRLANDTFTITQAANVTNGKGAYHIVDNRDNNVQGWVSADAVKTTPTRYFDSTRDLKVNFVNNGQTVASQIIDVSTLANAAGSSAFQNPSTNDRLLTSAFVSGLFNAPATDGSGFTIADPAGSTTSNNKKVDDLTSFLAKLGYAVTSADYNYSVQQNSNFNNVKVGDSININVSKSSDVSNTATSKLNFKSITPDAAGQWNPANATNLDSSTVTLPSLNDAQAKLYENGFTGTKGQFVDFSKAFSTTGTLFDATSVDGVLAAFDGVSNNVSVTSAAQYTNGKNGVLAFKDFASVKKALSESKGAGVSLANADASEVTPVAVGSSYHYAYVYDATATSKYNAQATVYGQPLTVIYDKVPVATPAATTATSTSNTNYINK